MPENYEISHTDGITIVKLFVKPSLKLAISILDKIAKNYPYERRLWDLSEVKFDFTTNEIQQISLHSNSIFTKPNKLAIYVTDDLAYGEMRQLMVYREAKDKATSQVFRDKQEAINWLNS